MMEPITYIFILALANFIVTAALFVFILDFAKEIKINSSCHCESFPGKKVETAHKMSDEEVREFLKPRAGGDIKHKSISFTDEELFNRELRR